MKRTIFRVLAVSALLLTFLFVGGYIYISHQVKGSYFTSEGIQIHYTDDGEGVPVILVHGFAANSDMNWRHPGIHKRLRKEGFRVITMDVRGHGLSGKPHSVDDYGFKMARDVVNLVLHLGIEKAHLVGYSLGGFISLKCAVEFPEYWLSVTPMASGWEDPENSVHFRGLEKAISDMEAGKPVGPLIDYFDETGTMKSGFLHQQMFKVVMNYLNDIHALIALAKSISGLRVERSRLEQITLPVCSIIGSQDPFLKIAGAMAVNIPRAQIKIVQKADHLNMAANANAKDALVNFLKAHSN